MNLTHESEYAHELWHGICMTLCSLSGQDEKPLISSFHLSSTLSIFKSMLQKLDRPVIVLIDDANLIKYGRILSILDKPFRKCLTNLVLIATSTSPITIPFMPPPTLIELPEFTTNDIVRYIKLNVSENELTVNSQQIAEIKNIVSFVDWLIVIFYILL